MKAFALRLAVDTPVALRDLLHLDAVLGSLACRNGGSYDDLPLQRTEGVYHGSAAMLETSFYGPSEESYVRVKAVREVPDAVRSSLPAGGRSIGPMSPYRPALSRYPVLRGVKAVWFAGRGDPEAVANIMAGTSNIGAMANTGHGRVTEMAIVEAGDSVLAGISLAGGMPARAVPMCLWTQLGLARPNNAVVGAMRWHGPYWDGPTAICIAPINAMLRGTHTEIRDLLAIGQGIAPARG